MSGQRETIVDYITGKKVENIGAEGNRQAVARFLVEERGFAREDIALDVPISFSVGGEHYESAVDLVISLGGEPFMAIKCAAGSLGSREREILAASRLLGATQIPFCAVSDGKDAVVLDTVTGTRAGKGMGAFPPREEALELAAGLAPSFYPPERVERERLIFRSYDAMAVNVRGR
jgi:hypothetical protein